MTSSHPSNAAVRCMVVDDHAALREGVRAILFAEHDLEVVGDAASGDAAVEMAAKRLPDVVVMDIQLGEGIGGFEATRRILAARPQVGIVILTGFGERGLLTEGLDCGARGYLLKDSPPADIVRAVRTVAAGGSYVDPSLASQLINPSSGRLTSLTDREREMLALLSQGLTSPRIAQQLFLSEETVRTHVRNAMRKLEADTRTQAVAMALRMNVIV